jgi:hypothetical protein
MKKLITVKIYIFIMPAFLIMSLLFISCKKEINSKTDQQKDYSTRHTNSAQKKIFVSNVEELYAAVNDPENIGAVIIMAAGNYVLNAGYPNGGRLELQADMSLSGQPGHSEDVIIDQSALPASSFTISAGRTGGIRMGRGSNALEWLSITGGAVGANPFSVINTDLLSTETSIGIYHVYVNMNGSNLGINFRNRLAEHANRKIYAEMYYSEVTGGINFNGAAVAVQNANLASGSLIELDMKENFIHGNRIGLFVFNTGQTSTLLNSTINIVSHGDRIEGNGVGLDPSGGVCQSAAAFANDNTTTIKMYASSISNNNPADASQLRPVNGALPGGMFLAGGYNSVNNISGYNRASNNLMKIECWGCDISNNNGTDIRAYAAWCEPACVLAGSNNLLEIYLYGLSANATVDATASVPFEPAGTNVVNVVRN